jgi:hypothetical protein
MMKSDSGHQLAEVIDPVKAQQEINLIKYKRALARRNFMAALFRLSVLHPMRS